MPTLREILAERKRKETLAQAQEVSADTETITEESVPVYVFHEPLDEFETLFDGCTDF